MKDYVVMDLENPNSRQNSISAIGTILVRDNKIVDDKYSLINPEDNFEPFNMQLTGITPRSVKNSPTLVEYWHEIEDWLTNNVVVGHNITYDLRVLSRSLARYNMEVPDFKYCCTLTHSRRNLKLKSYKLENIAKKLHIIYNPHIASEDARAAYQLFEYLNRKKEIGIDQAKNYHYKTKTKEKYDPKLSTNINNLYGMIRVILFEEYPSNQQLKLLDNWLKENSQYKQYPLFDDITSKLTTILNKSTIDGSDRKILADVVPAVTTSSIYSKNTLTVQVLQGIIKTITADNKVTMEELNNLNTWLTRNRALKGTYPYDKIVKITDNTLKKGFITIDEQKQLALTFKETMNPQKETNETIDFKGKTFCLSGFFKHGNKEEITKILKKQGLIEKTAVSGKVDYLFVGSMKNPAWKYGNIGGKIIKAQQLQEKGHNIKIISENNLFKELNNKK
ncbi:exonuclease domain-containing protein [Methanosphaera sp.]